MPEQSEDAYTHPDYTQGEWYQLIKSLVMVVSGDMLEHGTDPKTIAPDDAWRQYVTRVWDNWAAAGMSRDQMPREMQEFNRLESPAAQEFSRLWKLQQQGLVLP